MKFLNNRFMWYAVAIVGTAAFAGNAAMYVAFMMLVIEMKQV